jgi:hypothetical protein
MGKVGVPDVFWKFGKSKSSRSQTRGIWGVLNSSSISGWVCAKIADPQTHTNHGIHNGILYWVVSLEDI